MKFDKPGYVATTVKTEITVDDSLIYREYDVSPTGELFGEVRVWEELLLLAAEEMAKAFGAHLGEGLSQALIDSLFGKKDDTAFQAEVIARLTRIETKLDDLIRYLKRDFPEVVRKIVDEGHAEATRKQLNTSSAEVAGELSNFRSRRTPETANQLRTSAIAAAKLGHQLLQYGPASYSSGIHAGGTLLSAMSELMRFDKEKYRRDFTIGVRMSNLDEPPQVNMREVIIQDKSWRAISEL